MEKLKSRGLFKFGMCISVVLIAALVVLFSSIISAQAQNTNEDDPFTVTATKNVSWDDSTYAKGKIDIESAFNGQLVSDFRVLFIGTLCSAHCNPESTQGDVAMMKSIINNAMNSMADYADID